MKPSDASTEWRKIQQEAIKAIHVRMVEAHLGITAVLRDTGVSLELWNQYCELKRAMKVEHLVAVCGALNIRVNFTLARSSGPHAPPS